MSVGIVGGGLLGLTVGYRLAQRGAPVTVYEAADRLGGPAGTIDIDGVRVDRGYHPLALTDKRLLDLVRELGLGGSIRWRPLGLGIFHEGRLESISSPRELFRFPGLRARDRARLAAFMGRCRLISDPMLLDYEPIESWARRTAGDGLWERLWGPLLDSRFDGFYGDVPATYLWSRIRRTSGARDRSGREVMGWMRGGQQQLADALAEAIRGLGGRVLTGTPVRSIVSAQGRVQGVAVSDGFQPHDRVVSTLLRPHLDPLLGPDVESALPLDPCRYLGVVCVVARVRRSVSPHYAVYITDPRVAPTSVVETTRLVDPEHAHGHLVYVPRYVQPDSPELERSAAEITRDYLAHVQRIFPGFRPDQDVIASHVTRTRYAEPIHRVCIPDRVPPLVAAPGLAVASSAHVYPETVNAEAIVGVAERVAAELSGESTPASSKAGRGGAAERPAGYSVSSVRPAAAENG